MEYQDLKNSIKSNLNSASENFFIVGYCLRQISENALFMEDGYKSIWDFAKGEYGLSTSSASRFMAINARFSVDGGEHMAQKYIGMGVSKLQEMLGLPDEELEKVTQETTVREIRAMKAVVKEPLSFFGLHKTVRPEDSLLTSAGCGDGKYDCFNCSRPCPIRQEERLCRTAPLGKPFSCTQMDEEKRKDIEVGMFSDECQHLHQELAPFLKGNMEPDPCCLTCKHKTCFTRCDVAKKSDEAEKKKIQKELRGQQQEAEARKPEPSDRDIKAFYDYEHIKPTDTLTAAAFKDKLKNTYRGGGSLDYQGGKEQPEQDPDIIDADFREVEDEPKDDPVQEAAEARDEHEDDEDLLCDDCANASTLTGNVDLCANCGPSGANYKQLQPDPEYYGIRDVEELLEKHEADLKAYREVGGMPERTMRKQRILVDALTLFLHDIEQRKMDVEGGSDDD